MAEDISPPGSPAGFFLRRKTPAGPGATIRYVAAIKDGRQQEGGHNVRERQEPHCIRVELRRVSDSDWPCAVARAAKVDIGSVAS